MTEIIQQIEAPQGEVTQAAAAPTGEVTTTNVETTQEANSAQGASTAASPLAPAPKPDWRDKRIAKLTAQLREIEKSAAARQTVSGTTAPSDTAAIDARVAELAELRAAQQLFERDALALIEAGRASYPDFNDRVQAFASLQSTDPSENAKYTQLLQAVMDTGEGPKLLHSLGGDIEEAERLMRLSPTKLGIELARMATKVAEPVSSAPKPIRPVGQGAAKTNVEISPDDKSRADQLSTREWMTRRNAQDAERAKARRGY